MRFEYTGRHIEVTPALKAHVEEHFDRIRSIFDDESAHAHVVIEVERGRHHSEIIVKWRHEVITANSVEDDMYLSLSKTIDKIEKQARKEHDKTIDRHHKGQKAVDAVEELNADKEQD
jgi:putative sigma-54 modulation protein